MREFKTYGFNYSTAIGNKHPEHVWYSHTDLELDKMIEIKTKIRDPLIEKIKEAKEYEDIYKKCMALKEAKRRAERLNDTNEESSEGEGEEGGEEGNAIAGGFDDIPLYPPGSDWDPFSDPWEDYPIYTAGEGNGEENGEGEESGTTQTGTCADYTCEGLKEKINAIPLECQLISENLGEDWSGSDLNDYWWYGWLPSQWLSKVNYINNETPYSGTTAGIPFTFEDPQTSGPPYQSIVGIYQCPLLRDTEDGTEPIDVINPQPNAPYYDAFGGFTADVCGCVQEPDSMVPDYLNGCKFPSAGPRYAEYLEYVRSVGCRYWDAPLKVRLLRKAQMALLQSQQIKIKVPGNLELRIGDIISIIFPPAIESENVFSKSPGINPMSGKWLVMKIQHLQNSNNYYYMNVSCIRDSSPIGSSS